MRAIAFGYLRVSRRYALFYPIGTVSRSQATIVANFHRRYDCRYRRLRQIGIASRSIENVIFSRKGLVKLGREKDHAKTTSAFASCRDQRRCKYKRLNPAGDTSRVGDKDSLGQITQQDREQGREQGQEQGQDRGSFPFPVSPCMPFPYQFYVDVHVRQDHSLMRHNQPNRNPGPL